MHNSVDALKMMNSLGQGQSGRRNASSDQQKRERGGEEGVLDEWVIPNFTKLKVEPENVIYY